MGLFQRLFKVGQAEAHAIVDKLEDPIKLTEQGIKDLKSDLDKSLQALAEVKALAIRTKRELSEAKNKAKSYEQKAMLLLQKAEKGDIDPSEADRLATEALQKKEEALQNANRVGAESKRLDTSVSQLETNINKIKSNISHYENELKTLKARARVSSATTKINKSMAGVDTSSTVAMLEKMKQQVEADEALSEAYGDMADANRSIDEEIEDAIGGDSSAKASSALEELKKKMNQNK